MAGQRTAALSLWYGMRINTFPELRVSWLEVVTDVAIMVKEE